MCVWDYLGQVKHKIQYSTIIEHKIQNHRKEQWEQTHHPASDETCTRCNLILVPTPSHTPPDHKVYTPTSYRTHCFYGSIFCVLLRHCIMFYVPLNLNSPTQTFPVLFTVFVLSFCYCKCWGSRNAQCILCMDVKHEGLKMIQYNGNMQP